MSRSPLGNLGSPGSELHPRLGLETPLVPEDVVYAKFSSELVKELVGPAKKVDNILEEECCDLFFVAATRVFSHLLLHEPHFEFGEVMVPMPEESCSDLATTVEVHMRMLLEKFSYDDDEELNEKPLPCHETNYHTLDEA
ncbi:hypothetical protein D1007_25340 [Hordeum vulgare]|nr:hypothetical protein D1007_25340 [Hordeum vulgare]